MELFLNLNGWYLEASDAVCISMMQTLAAGSLSEEMLAKWLRGHIAKE
jgi:prophage maintenance system killer protein